MGDIPQPPNPADVPTNPPWQGQPGAQPAPPATPARRRRIPVLGWVGIGCGGAMVLVGAFVAVLVLVVFHAVGAAGCPPSDLPTVSGASRTGTHLSSGSQGHTCDLTYRSSESSTQVESFYIHHLNQGDWRITSEDPQTGVITFQRVHGRPVAGALKVTGTGSSSVVQIDLASATGSFGP